MAESSDARPYLAKLSELFKAEGDEVTARALIEQLRAHPADGLPADDAECLEWLMARADRACLNGDYERAKPAYLKILAMREAALGPQHLDTLSSLNDLARCHYNNSEFDKAELIYRRLLRIALTTLGRDDRLTQITADNVRNCTEAMQRVVGTHRLSRCIDAMLRSSTAIAQVLWAERTERLHDIATRLKSRGKYRLALQLFQDWIRQRLDGADPYDEQAIQDIARHARFLMDAGQLAKAQSMFAALVHFRSRQHAHGPDVSALMRALTDLATVQFKQGHNVAARTTLELAARMSSELWDATRSPFIVADLETTNDCAATGEILQFAGLLVAPNGEIMAEFSQLVSVRVPVAAWLLAELGLSHDDIDRDGRPLADAMKSFIKFVGARPVFIHHAEFDERFLRAAAQRTSQEFGNTVHDTLRLAERTWPELKRHCSATLADHLGVAMGRGTALDCAKVTLATLMAARKCAFAADPSMLKLPGTSIDDSQTG